MAKKKEEQQEDSGESEVVEKIQAKQTAPVEGLDTVVYVDASKKLRKKYGKVADISIKIRDPFIPNPIEQEIRDNLSKSRMITASELALKYNIRISAMKKLFKQLESEGLLKCIGGNSRIKMYTPTRTK